ncbi:hypothetical protein TKK_0000314 [Trichogramma kaykai]
MVKVCLICKKKQSKANPGLSFHKACKTTSTTINNKVICSNHFTDNDYPNKAGGQKRRLHQEAVPSRNLPSAWTICHEIVNNIVASALLKTSDAVVEICNGEQCNELIENAGKRVCPWGEGNGKSHSERKNIYDFSGGIEKFRIIHPLLLAKWV